MRRLLVITLAVLLGSAVSAWADRPTDFYTPVNKTVTSTAVNTDVAIWTPASGFRIAIMGCAVSSGGAQQTLLEFTNVAVYPTIYTAADTPFNAAGGGPVIAVGATDEALSYTTSSSTTTTINCYGYEWKG